MTDMPTDSAPAVDWAVYYATLGWSVVPVRPREKTPLIPWQSRQEEAADTATIRRWFGRWPDANVGIVTGAVSRLVVLDIDPAHGGETSLAAAEGLHGPLLPSPEVQTGGGGRHVYFAHPGERVPNAVGVRPGLDLRGDGGYVVAPPSIHPSGRAYIWTRLPDMAPLRALPEWLTTRVPQAPEDAGTDTVPRLGHPLSYWRALVREGVDEGGRNKSVAALAGHLLWHGVDPTVLAELLVCWNAVRCRPPLPVDEVVETVKSIIRTHDRHAQRPGQRGPAAARRRLC